MERIFSVSENTHFSASDKLFNSRGGMAKLSAAVDSHLFDMLYVEKQHDIKLFNFSDLS